MFILIHHLSVAQSLKIGGRVIDAENGAPVPGATVLDRASKRGTSTDVDGKFFVEVGKDTKITLEISSLGFVTKTIDDISWEQNGSDLEIALSRETAQLQQVTVKSSAAKESVSALFLVQKNSSSISDGISADVIRKSPDKNTGDVLKRVSGASVQENKFVIIRGLSERYNASLLNNSVLPSTEPDKKAFAFDIIPSSLVDHLVIYKSPTPDLPGDFAGGAVKITTKDYPSKKISDLSIATGYNSLTTFHNFYSGFPEDKFDWLGFFGHSRLIPNAYYSNKSQFINLTDEQKSFATKQFSNTYGYQPAYRSMPDFSITYTGGDTRLLRGSRRLGYIYAVGYGEGRRVSTAVRDEYENYDFFDYRYNTSSYSTRNNISALLNLTYSNGKNKLSWKTLYHNAFVKSVGIRNGYDISNGEEYRFNIKSSNTEASANGIINSVVEGSHGLGGDIIIDWNASYGRTYRWQPDQKILALHTSANDDVYNLTLSNENSPEVRNAGRVYAFLTEDIYGANVNITKKFNWMGQEQKLKIGSANYYRSRNAEVDALGYSVLNSAGNRLSIPEGKTTSFATIFSPENIDAYHLTVANIMTNSTDYTGMAMMNGGYAMLEDRFSTRLKMTWGIRVENYSQELKSTNRQNIRLANFDVLPSLLLTYSLGQKTNLRFAVSQTVNRPEFRELADYSVYDYDNNFVVRGNPDLRRCKNSNVDMRYEWFPSAGEILSASVFYKYFSEPIEQVNNGNDVLSYANADNATVYGAEVEVRKKLDFLGAAFLQHFTVYANGAYIKGSVKFAGVTFNSPLQGESPYLVNGGITYSTRADGFSVNLLYNRVGPRLKFRAITGASKNIFEQPRDVMDIQVAKKFMHQKLEARLTVNDIFAQAYVWYYQFGSDASNTNYDPAKDRIINSVKNGTTTTLSVRYSFR